MLILRKAEERGKTQLDWLTSYHSFSFGSYYDPSLMGFGSLCVINDDIIAPQAGFGMHPHKNMEILTYILKGTLEHQDSLGNKYTISSGEVQRMSAGTGIVHREINAFEREVHLLQIWILPNKKGITPSYDQKSFTQKDKRGRFLLIASEKGQLGSLSLHQDINIFAALIDGDEAISYPIKEDQSVWVHVARGQVTMNELNLKEGDGVAVVNERVISFKQGHDAEILLFDMAPFK